MGLKEFRDSIREEVQGIISSGFKIVITDTKVVPSIDDTDITRAGGYYNGKVRNVIGDRLMVIFDSENCFANAVNTAVLLNSVSKFILNKNFSHDEVKCGIGIDYGKMLVAKAGIIKNGKENTPNKSLVWLGRPANIASKLTDAANKTDVTYRQIIMEGCYYPTIKEWGWYDREIDSFLNQLIITYSPILRHSNQYFSTFFKTVTGKSHTTSPILMTKDVYDGFKNDNPNDDSIKQNWWEKQKVISISGYNGDIYGGDVNFNVFKE